MRHDIHSPRTSRGPEWFPLDYMFFLTDYYYYYLFFTLPALALSKIVNSHFFLLTQANYNAWRAQKLKAICGDKEKKEKELIISHPDFKSAITLKLFSFLVFTVFVRTIRLGFYAFVNRLKCQTLHRKYHQLCLFIFARWPLTLLEKCLIFLWGREKFENLCKSKNLSCYMHSWSY